MTVLRGRRRGRRGHQRHVLADAQGRHRAGAARHGGRARARATRSRSTCAAGGARCGWSSRRSSRPSGRADPPARLPKAARGRELTSAPCELAGRLPSGRTGRRRIGRTRVTPAEEQPDVGQHRGDLDAAPSTSPVMPPNRRTAWRSSSTATASAAATASRPLPRAARHRRRRASAATAAVRQRPARPAPHRAGDQRAQAVRPGGGHAAAAGPGRREPAGRRGRDHRGQRRGHGRPASAASAAAWTSRTSDQRGDPERADVRLLHDRQRGVAPTRYEPERVRRCRPARPGAGPRVSSAPSATATAPATSAGARRPRPGRAAPPPSTRPSSAPTTGASAIADRGGGPVDPARPAAAAR